MRQRSTGHGWRLCAALIIAAGLLARPVSAYAQNDEPATSDVPITAERADTDDRGEAQYPPAGEPPALPAALTSPPESGGIRWLPVIGESLLFLTLEHSLRITNELTRSRLDGPFVNDWFDSVASLDRFDDQGKILTNWVAHPMQGSVSAFILGQNDPTYVTATLGDSQYWKSKRRQLLFATVYSTQFELGLLSESSIGNIHQAAIDLILTPTLGTVWSIGEDLAAQHLLKSLRVHHPKWANTLAIFLNPTRSLANVLAFKAPWTCDVAICR